MRDFKQHDVTDCGAACLAYVFHRHGLAMSISSIRQKTGTNRNGTTALGLVDTAQFCGFDAKGIRCKFEDLKDVPLPGIAHVVLGGGRLHYVVVCGIGKKEVTVMDPAAGRVQKWSHDKFRGCWSNVFIILAPSVNFAPSKKTDGAWNRLWTLLQPQKAVLMQAFVGVVLGTILSLASAVYIQKIIDNVIVDGNRNLLRLLGIGMLCVLVVRMFLGYFQSILMLRSAQRIDAGLILGYYRHLMRLPQSFFDTMRVGEITSRVRDAVAVRDFLNGTILNLVLNPLILIFSLVAMFTYSWRLALLSLALIPANAVIYFASDWLNKRYQREIMERSADFDAQLVESLHAMSVVRSCGLEDQMSFRSETRLVRLLKRVWSAGNAGLLVGAAGSFITQAYSVGLLWIGASLVLDSQLTAGELMSCNALAGYLTGPIMAIIGMNAGIRTATTATERLYEIMDLEREKDEGPSELRLEPGFTIEIEQLNFRHAGRLATLKDLSLRFRSGEITALVGKSGCGKSTLLAVLQRLYLPESGSILFGGTDIQYVKLALLRAKIAYVPQRIDLLAGSVLENLCPGESQPDMPRVVDLCRQVGILDFIESLPRGFQTLITENGANLSGGQKQRLAIVRAFYADAPIVLMDEPSSALDVESEDMLIQAVRRMREKGKLVILAVHNRRMLAICDRVVEMADGKVIRQYAGASGGKEAGDRIETISVSSEKVSAVSDPNATKETKALFERLRDRADDGVLFGQTDANVVGVDEHGRGWHLQSGRCDIEVTTGRWPGIFGFEIPELRRGWRESCGYLVPKIREAHDQGGVICVAWYPENLVTGADRWSGSGVADVLMGGSHHAELRKRLDLIAENIGNLRDSRGQIIPILFRCAPQANGERFWWSGSRCTAEEYARLFRFCVTYLREVRKVHNLLHVYSVHFGNEPFACWQERYPGDEYVDVLSVDRIADETAGTQNRFLDALSAVVRFAADHGKVAGVSSVFCYRNPSEQGLQIANNPDWLSTCFLNPLKNHPVAGRIRFLLFWRNEPARPDSYQLPPPQSPYARDFRRVAEDPFWRFADENSSRTTFHPDSAALHQDSGYADSEESLAPEEAVTITGQYRQSKES